MKTLTANLLAGALAGCILAPAQAMDSCSDITWSDLESWIGPYVEPHVMTAFIMLANSAEYNVVHGADEALLLTHGTDLPAATREQLLRISRGECP